MSNSYNWVDIVNDLNRFLRLKNIPAGMKLFESKEDMMSINNMRIPTNTILACQALAQAVRIGFTVGVTADNFPDKQCAAILGIGPQDEEWLSGRQYLHVWYKTEKDATAHQQAHFRVPAGKYKAIAFSPLVSNRFNPPDICIMYATPAQVFMLIAGLQHTDFQKLEWSMVGE